MSVHLQSHLVVVEVQQNLVHLSVDQHLDLEDQVPHQGHGLVPLAQDLQDSNLRIENT